MKNYKTQDLKNKGDWILFINYMAYPCIVGGSEIFNLNLINELGKKYNTHVLTFCKECEQNDDVVVHVIKQLKFSKISTPLIVLWFLFKNRKRIKLLHFSYSEAYWTHIIIFVIAKKLFGIKYMMTIHAGSLSKWNPKLPFKMFFKQANKITGVSHRIIKEYTKRSKRNDLIFTPPLVPFKIITPKNKFRDKWMINEDDIILLYVGSLKPLKSVDTLIEALGIISLKKLKQYKLKLIIAGNGMSRKEIEDRVYELNLSDIVRFLGNVRTDEIHEIYNLADIYTICSEYEGLPISTLEAFANGLPCITSNAPGLYNISENNKNTLMFETKNSVDFANKIERVLNDLELREKLKINGKAYYKNLYTYDKLISIFVKIIDEI